MPSYDPTLLSCVRRRAVFNLALLSAFVWATTDNRALPVAAQGHNGRASQARPLSPGATIKDELRGGQTHSFQLPLAPAQFARFALRAARVELTVKLLRPDGQVLAETAYPRDTPQPIFISFVAGYIGAHQLQVTSREKEETARPYEIKFEELSLVTTRTAQLAAADEAFSAGEGFRSKETENERRPAVAEHELALRRYQALSDRSGEAHALYALGRVYDSLNERDKAPSYLDQALSIRRELRDRAGEADVLNAQGNIYNATDRKKAIELFQQVLQLRRELRDERGAGHALQNLGQTHRLLNERDRALEYLQQALQIRRQARDQQGEADTLVQLGVLARQRGADRQQTLDYYAQARTIYQALGLEDREAFVAENTATLFLNQGEWNAALPYLTAALETRRRLAQRRPEAQLLDRLGSAYSGLGDTEKALDYYQQALRIQRAIKQQFDEANTLNNIGQTLSENGQLTRALEHFAQARPLARAGGGPIAEAVVLLNMGDIYRTRGDWQRALDYYQEVLAIWRQAKDPREAGALNLMGLLNQELGEHQQARLFFTQALENYRKLNSKSDQAAVLSNLGVTLQALDDKAQASAYFEQAQALVKDNPRGTVSALNNTARFYGQTDDHQQALALLQQAWPLAEKLGSRPLQAQTLHNLGWEYHQLKETVRARDYFTQSLNLYHDIGNLRGEASTLFGLALVENEAGDLAAARTHIEAALAIAEQLRANVGSQGLRASYFASVQKYYELYIELLMKQHQQQGGAGWDAAALQASERARARSLLDLLSEASADIRAGVDKQLLDRERELREQLNAKAQRQSNLLVNNAPREQIEQVGKELQTLSHAQQELQAQIRRASPRYAALTQPQPLTLKEIQQQVLDDDTLLLEYALGEQRSFLWVVTPTTLKSYALPKRAAIEESAREVYEALTARNYQVPGETESQQRRRIALTEAQLAPAARRLSRMVLAPAARELGRKRLLIVAQGALQYVPFGVLPALGGRQAGENRSAPSSAPLITAHEIISLPSASTLAVLRREIAGRTTAAKTLAVFADPVFEKDDERVTKLKITTETPAARPDAAKPDAAKSSAVSKPAATPKLDTAQTRLLKHATDKLGAGRIPRLPYTRQEAEEILALVPANERHAALGFAANRAALAAPELKQYRYLHFATHGVLDREHPELSAVLLSLVDEQGRERPEGFLRAHEVYNLDLAAEAIVLSACETGLGKEVKGEGLVGLTRGFMYAGAPRVVVSLWAVNDPATAQLMTRFYRKLLTAGLRPAAALRAAQIELRRDPQWAAPYYWASFTLQGEWR